jgi:hypothetical protein
MLRREPLCHVCPAKLHILHADQKAGRHLHCWGTQPDRPGLQQAGKVCLRRLARQRIQVHACSHLSSLTGLNTTCLTWPTKLGLRQHQPILLDCTGQPELANSILAGLHIY